MSATPDATTKPRSRRKPRRIWHLATNHQNMLYMLAAGMVMGPAGFRGKHYFDSLSVYPGWIPLFRDDIGVPADALNQATSERNHLLPCIASFDLSELSGLVRVLSRDGATRDVATPAARKRKDDIAILVRAPLPLNLLRSIGLRSSEDKQSFEDNAWNVANIDLSPHRIEVAESLFATAVGTSWPPDQRQVELFVAESDDPPVLGQTLGGILAMLYHTANRSDLGLAAYRLAVGAGQDKDSDLVQSNPILARLPDWVHGHGESGQSDTRARLYWGVIQSLLVAQKKEHPQSQIDVALEYLESQLDKVREIELEARLERLIVDMRNCRGLGGGTVTELLERHKDTLSKTLMLFCLRESCADLLEFSHPSITDADYVLAGILFGVRDSWLQLPRELRDAELFAFVSYQMAEAQHRESNDGLILGEFRRPMPPAARQAEFRGGGKPASAKETGVKPNGNDSSCG
ncbi:MAG: hypothetical protein F4030_14035 [Gammaproteobacteria bacterium]|nr:hypothetical protein [Gammaproteobacteria bacterium]MYH84721.1 hypothetical protein [Gammaproteobacteria bacterium]MYK06095.1 hypothetical protein [Gammaproteobacteria bacterium]